MKMPDIVSYTSEELAAMRGARESRTDWQRVKAMTDADIETAIAEDLMWRKSPMRIGSGPR